MRRGARHKLSLPSEGPDRINVHLLKSPATGPRALSLSSKVGGYGSGCWTKQFGKNDTISLGRGKVRPIPHVEAWGAGEACLCVYISIERTKHELSLIRDHFSPSPNEVLSINYFVSVTYWAVVVSGVQN